MNDPSFVLSGSTEPEDLFLKRVRQATVSVLGDSAVGRAVRQLCDSHAEVRRSITTDRASGAMVVAIVGATGQGKSWLMRQFISSPGVVAAIRSGNNLDEATERIVWVGPVPPANLDVRHEQYLHCPSDQMHSLRVPYLLVDTPGATDNRRDVSETARLALSMASVLLVVVRRDQLRSHTVDMLASASEGSLVVPVINAIGEVNESVRTDTEAFTARIRKAAPLSQVTSPVYVEDFEKEKRVEELVGKEAVSSIDKALSAELAQGESIGRTVHRLAALDAKFRTALHASLHDQLPGLTLAVKRLHEEAKVLPEEIAESLVGGGPSLRAAIRSRLRASLLIDTSAIWFPYRTILGVLSLTSGAWDRVVLSLAGSLPSLITAAYTGIQNFSQSNASAADLREGIRRRSAAAVNDRLGPLANRFRAEIYRLSHNGTHINDASGIGKQDAASLRSQPAYLSGIDTLQEQSQQIFDAEIDRAAASRTAANLFAFIGTATFWALMAGPIVALYQGYLRASYSSLRELAGNLSAFPRAEFALMFTSVVLSVLPTAIFTMFVLSWVQSRRRVEAAEQAIRIQHHDAIALLQKERVLRLEWDEPLLSDAEFLLTAGANEVSQSREPSK